MLELQHIHKYYNPGTVNEMCLFEDFNLSIKKGQFVSVVGSNGSGKTSMLNIVCGSITPDSGKILIEGQDITKEKEYRRLRRIGRVYQNPAMGTCPNMKCGKCQCVCNTALGSLDTSHSENTLRLLRRRMFSPLQKSCSPSSFRIFGC